MTYAGYRYLNAYLEEKYKEEDWLVSIVAYLQYRFLNISERMWETFRYVDPSPDNAKVYSYEYSSILRDIGSVFGSVLDSLVRETVKRKKRYTI
jgi:hypothetical protein